MRPPRGNWAKNEQFIWAIAIFRDLSFPLAHKTPTKIEGWSCVVIPQKNGVFGGFRVGSDVRCKEQGSYPIST